MLLFFVFFFNDTATTEIYTLSLHDALPISGVEAQLPQVAVQVGEVSGVAAPRRSLGCLHDPRTEGTDQVEGGIDLRDRKSTRLNSSHANISYAVFCLKKKKQIISIKHI